LTDDTRSEAGGLRRLERPSTGRDGDGPTDGPPPGRRPRARPTWALLAVAALLLGALIGAAAVKVLSPPAEITADRPLSTAVVTPGEVGSTVTLAAGAQWSAAGSLTNLAVGVVTEVYVHPGQTVGKPKRVYRVNERPVFLAAGKVPAFRDISNTTRGRDVAELQRMLNTLGFEAGRADGRGGAGLSAAIKRWQRASGFPVDGVMHSGDVIFTPSLPVMLALSTPSADTQDSQNASVPPTLRVGVRLQGGEAVFDRLTDDPQISVTTAKEQAAQFPEGTPVTARFGSKTWPGRISRVDTVSDQLVLHLTNEEGQAICSPDCSGLAVDGSSVLYADLEVVKAAKGLSVPSTALQTKADGSAFVVTDDGVEHPVTVVAGDSGVVIVTGVAEGARVRLFSDAPR
jgi:peptidoglycan hydrolase-like protein with peptidoglycan-binding domain